MAYYIIKESLLCEGMHLKKYIYIYLAFINDLLEN